MTSRVSTMAPIMPTWEGVDTAMNQEQNPSGEDVRIVIQEQRARIEALERRQRALLLPRRMLMLFAAAGLIALGALSSGALASGPARIPDATGVIHGCYSTKTGNLRVTTGSCRKGEKPLNWSAGAPGKFCPRCSLDFADLHNRDLTGAYLPLTSLESVNLSHAQLGMAYLVRVFMDPGTPRQVNGTPQPAPPSNLDHAYFAFADLRGASLNQVHAPSAYFGGADMHYTYLNGANFFQAGFVGADLSLADAEGTYFRGASLESANIQDMNLANAILTDTDLRLAHGKPYSTQNTVYSNTTCPDGTNSSATVGNTCDGHWLP